MNNPNIPQLLRSQPVSHRLLRVASCALLAGALGISRVHAQAVAPSADPNVKATAEIDRKDRNFLMKAHTSGLKEIELAQAVATRSANPQVQEFARMLVSDHERVAQELQSLAQTRNVMLEPLRENAVRKLGNKTGVELDKDFLEMAEDEHEDAIDLFEDAAKDSKDSEIRTFASRHLESLRTHLAQVRQLKEVTK